MGIISAYVGNIKKSEIYVSPGRKHANILFKLHNQMQGVKINHIFGCWK